jgi:hypothetical protein
VRLHLEASVAGERRRALCGGAAVQVGGQVCAYQGTAICTHQASVDLRGMRGERCEQQGNEGEVFAHRGSPQTGSVHDVLFAFGRRRSLVCGV